MLFRDALFFRDLGLGAMFVILQGSVRATRGCGKSCLYFSVIFHEFPGMWRLESNDNIAFGNSSVYEFVCNAQIRTVML